MGVSDARIAYERGVLLGEGRLSLFDTLREEDDESRALRSFLLLRCGRVPEDIDRPVSNSMAGLLLRSIVSMRLGRFADAAECAQRALNLEAEGAPRALSLLSAAQLSSGIPAAAQPVLGSPNLARGLVGAIQSLSLDVQEARELEMALVLSPSASEFLVPLGRFLLKLGDAQTAYGCATKLLQSDPHNSDAHNLAARALVSVGEEVGAARHWTVVLEDDQANPDALNGMGFLLQAKGDFAEAIPMFRKSLAARRAQGAAHWGLKVGDSKGGEDVECLIREAENLPMSPSERALANYAIAKTLADAGKYEEAMVSYDEANRLAALAQWGGRPFDRARYEQGYLLTRQIFTEEFLQAWRHLANQDATPIFIVGMMRSGTTLMEQVLSSHPLVTAGGEVSFWLERGPKVVDPNSRGIDPYLARQLVTDYLAGLRKLASSGMVTDKHPENLQMLGLIHVLLPRAKVIHMSRNPVDVCLSIYMTPYDRSAPFAHDKENIVFAYRQQAALMRHWRSVLPESAFLDVSYEELVDRSEDVIRRVLNYCGLPWDDACLRHDQNQRSVKTPSVWQVRQPIYKTSAEKWRRYESYLGAFSQLLAESDPKP
jgi:tetratricopeptide (TPR) repeat protein